MEGDDERSEEGVGIIAIAGQLLLESNIDRGSRTTIATVLGEPLRRWDDRDQVFRPQYDVLRRPTHLFLQVGASAEVLLEKRYYGDAAGVTTPESDNLKGKLVALYDGAGLLELGPYDFKGNLRVSARTLATTYTTTPTWNLIDTEPSAADAKGDLIAASALEDETFTETRAYDALNRVTSVLNGHDSSEYLPTYNEASLLEAVDVKVRGATSATKLRQEHRLRRQRTAHANRILERRHRRALRDGVYV